MKKIIRSLEDLNENLNNQLIITDAFLDYYNKELDKLFRRGLISHREYEENYIQY